MTVVRIPLHRLVIGPDHPPGLSQTHLADLIDGTRVDDRPLKVRPRGTYFEITNGRHRYTHALIVGLPDLPCVVRSTSHVG